MCRFAAAAPPSRRCWVTRSIWLRLHSGESQINDGKLKGLAVASPERNPAMPQVPTYKELGFPFVAESWVGFFVPVATDPAVIAKLNAAINGVMSERAGLEHLTKLGFQVRRGPHGIAGLNPKAEAEKWGEMVRTVGVYVD